MKIWTEPLTRENFEGFFRMYAPSAYRSTYHVLGDSTRTETALMEAFLELYHQKNNVADPEDLVFLFSDILQGKVDALAAEYSVAETSNTGNRNLDEFTENSILSEIYQRIDSTSYKVVEFLTANTGVKSSIKAGSFLDQFRKTGISLFLILQLLLVAVLIYFITSTGLKFFSRSDQLIPPSPDHVATPIDKYIVDALSFLPLTLNVPNQNIGGETTPTTSSGTSESATTTDSQNGEGTTTTTATEGTTTTAANEGTTTTEATTTTTEATEATEAAADQ